MNQTSHGVLVVTESASVAQWLEIALIPEKFQIQVVENGAANIPRIQQDNPDLIILDASISDISYIELCREMRANGIQSPIMVLAEAENLSDRIAVLSVGANDYLVKFSSSQELQSKMRANLQRSPDHQPHLLRYGDLVLDLLTKEVYRDGYQLSLTAREFHLLAYFMRYPRRVINRNQILEHVWGYEFTPNVVDVYIHYLRNKLERYNSKRLIHTVHRVGYILRC